MEMYELDILKTDMLIALLVLKYEYQVWILI
jgi:hypothetical protein